MANDRTEAISGKGAFASDEQTDNIADVYSARQGGELPFCFYTNGHEIFFWNLGEAPPQKVHGFPTRQDLERLLSTFAGKHKKSPSPKS